MSFWELTTSRLDLAAGIQRLYELLTLLPGTLRYWYSVVNQERAKLEK